VTDRPRVGIVGAGRVGVDWHLPNIRAAGGEVIALADVVPGRAARFAAQHHIPYAFDRYSDLLALPQIVYQAYRHVSIPADGDELLHFDMGLQLLKRERSLGRQVWEYLADRDRLLERLDPHLVRGERWNLWPEKEQPLQVSQLRDYFARYTQLPMLAGDEVLLQTIARGVEIKLFGYGHRAGEDSSPRSGAKGGDFSPLYFGQVVSPAQLEIADTAWLIPPDMAREHLLSVIAGRVLQGDGSPFSGVTVRLSPGGQAVTTGADGSFEFGGLSPTDYTLAPSKPEHTFSPASRSLSLSGEDVTGLEFVGSEVVGPPVTYELAGQVRTAEGQALAGVRLTIDPPVAAEAITDREGRYSFRRLQAGAYTVRPYKAGYTFKPPEIAVAVDRDVSGQDLVGEQETVGARRIAIRTHIPWENWYDFYSDVLDPLMSAGAEIDVRLELKARAEQELGADLVERLRDGLRRYDEDAEVDAG
jgi:hypothetical protein